ncbi:O-antigen ligase family protein [Flavobacterium fluviatile]|uniref:O-antigen ligase family protein n=1 Tax=Flavobacterium fluviatile TaxID=1862387 RepID=UPI0013D0404F|nr:O-antigen ligase family protein [Flavobacterium fluviatile]
MKNISLTYIYLLIIHALIALAIFLVPFLSKIYALLIPAIGFYVVYITKNKNHEVLLVAAYMVGVEVFLRMTGGNFNNEYIKLNVVFFMLLGMVYKGFSMNSFIYWIFLIFLIPGILVTSMTDFYSVDIRKAIVFNLSGPFCLALCAIYTLNRKILFSDLQHIVIAMGLPIITTTVYLVLYNPSVKDVITGTQSNFETSGGFGPNQVSTVLGLGMFVFFTQFIIFSKSKLMWFVNGSIVALISFRGIVTFSRGGVITGVFMIVILLLLLYLYSDAKGKAKSRMVIILSVFMGLGIWGYTSLKTSGLIDKRYANQDAAGRTKKDRLGGREKVMNNEINLFLENPILGAGAGLGKQFRKEMIGQEVASHNEITRMLSEHGLFGIFGLLILFATPLVLFINNRQHLYCLSFYFFWLLTINHAAMRTAAPAFVYALCLLSVQLKKPEKAVNSVN